MKIELVWVLPNGSGYCVVHQEDGSSFGQNFRGAPVGNAEALMAYLTARADQVAATQAPVPEVVLDDAVEALVGKQVEVVRPSTEGVVSARPA